LAEHIALWRQAIQRVAESALRAAIDDLDTNADALERRTAALSFFRNKLFFLFDPEARAKVREAKKKRPKKEGQQ
jgi:hypothetical protein